MDNLKSTLLATFSSIPAAWAAADVPSTTTIIATIVLPIIFFIASKSIDVFVQIWLRRGKKINRLWDEHEEALHNSESPQ